MASSELGKQPERKIIALADRAHQPRSGRGRSGISDGPCGNIENRTQERIESSDARKAV